MVKRTISMVVATSLLSVVGLFMSTAAHAATTQVICTDSSSTVVLKVVANGSATNGLARALKASQVAQTTLGVTCSQVPTTTSVSVPTPVKVLCTNAAGDVKVRLVANQAAFDGLSIGINAFAKTAGGVLGLTCSVVTS